MSVEDEELENYLEDVDDVNEEVDNIEEEDEPSSEVVERAKKYGHLSKEEWVAAGKDPDKYKTPEEFDKTGKVIEQLYALKKKVDQRDRELENVVKYHEKALQREYERAKQDLEARLARSKDDMDVEGVSHYTKELVRLQDNENTLNAQKDAQVQQQAQQSFIERNAHWFNDRNPDLKNRAIEIDNEIKADINSGRLRVNSLEEIAAMIEKRIAYEHPERVLGRSKVRPNISADQSALNKTAEVKKSAFKNLSQEHRDTYNVYKRINPKTTEADFIRKLKAEGEIN